MQASYSGQDQISLNSSTIESTLSKRKYEDSISSAIALNSNEIINAVEIVEEYDTSKPIDSLGSYPISKRTTRILTKDEMKVATLDLTGMYRENTTDTLYSSKEIDNQQFKSIDSNFEIKEKRGVSFANRLFTRIGVIAIIVVILFLLYLVFKPRLNTIVTIFKNILNR